MRAIFATRIATTTIIIILRIVIDFIIMHWLPTVGRFIQFVTMLLAGHQRFHRRTTHIIVFRRIIFSFHSYILCFILCLWCSFCSSEFLRWCTLYAVLLCHFVSRNDQRWDTYIQYIKRTMITRVLKFVVFFFIIFVASYSIVVHCMLQQCICT